MKLKPLTPAKVKADIIFLGSLIAVFGWSIPTPISVALIAMSGLIALGVNAVEMYAEGHLHFGKAVTADIDSALRDLRIALPAINQFATGLPGQVGEEVRKALELIEKGPGGGSSTAGKAK